MKKFLSCMLAVALGLVAGSPAFALDARPLVAADLPTMGGTDFDGGVGDILLRNDKVEAVILSTGATPDFGIPFAAEALPAAGVLVDAGTLGDKNDQLTEIDQVLNLDGRNVVLYGGAPILSVGGSTASVTVNGIGLLTVDPPGPPPPVVISSPSSPTIFATTTYSVTNGQSWINMTTVIFNANPFPAPVFQVADVDITVARGPLPFQPFPFRGTKSPPLDLSNPAAAIGVFSYVSVVGNNGPANGATNNDGSPSGEVNYTFTAPNVFSPLIGLASPIVTGAGNAFASLGSTIPAFGMLTHTRKLVIAKGNSVEAGLNIALPTLYVPVFGFDARATFTGTVVDGSSNPVPNASITFDNTFPGANPAYVTGFVTVVDDNQDGVPNAVIPAAGGQPLPTTQVVTDSSGQFTVKLQAFANPATTTSTYTGKVQAEERGTVTFGPLGVNVATIFGGPTNLGNIVLSDTGTVNVTVNDVATSSPTGAKLSFYGENGTDNPDLGNQYLTLKNFPGLSKRTGDGLTPVSEGNSGQLGEAFNGSKTLNVVFDEDGNASLNLKPGDYVAFASRGLEYTVDAKSFTVTAGGTTNVSLGIERVVDTSGFVSMDFHIHSAKSFDSSVAIADRVRTYLGEGLEVMVSTDHDFVTDYAPIISGLGIGSEINSIIGNELTGGAPVPVNAVATGGVNAFPEGIGHWNGWPLSVIANNRNNGAPQSEFINPGTAIDRLRGMDSLPLLGKRPDTATAVDWLVAAQAGQAGTPGAGLPVDDEVVMLNHPRAGFAGTVVIGLFNSLFNPGGNPLAGGYNPTLAIGAAPNNLLGLPSLYNAVVVGPGGTSTTGLSFDALEIMNGTSIRGYLNVRGDWFSLLDQGIHKAGTAVSDSHRPILENAAYGRSYVASSTDAPASVNADQLTANVKAMKIVGTSGPFIRFEVKDDGGVFHGLGETVVATGNKVGLKIRVEAAPWIPIEEVRIFRNGTLILTEPIQSTKILGKVLRYNKNLNVEGIDADSYFTVEAGVKIDGNGNPLSPALLETVNAVASGVVPLGFTNPIFVDRDGGGYVPPGL